MSERKLKLNKIGSLDSLKIEMLSLLKIRDIRKNCLQEFNSRIERYLGRNPTQIIRVVIDLENIKLRIKGRVKGAIKSVVYPKGFQFGQPNMMWGIETDSRSASEIELENKRIQQAYNEEYGQFIQGLSEIERIGKGQIIIDVKKEI